MMLFKEAKVSLGCSQYMFDGQAIVQKVFFFSAIACIPVMLFGKPLYVMYTKKVRNTGKTYVSFKQLLIFIIYARR